MSKTTGGGGGNFLENVFTDFVDVSVQTLTGGLVGFKGDGLEAGITGKSLVTGVKELTGAAAAEQANADARAQFEQQKVESDAARVESQNLNARSSVAKSKLAGSLRSFGSNKTTGSQAGLSGSSLGQDERTFLGL